MKILVIEDDPILADFLKVNLERECFAVDLAENGEKGLSLISTNQYDAIVSDYIMPKKNGLEVCQELRRMGNQTPFIIVSVKSEVSNKIDLLNAGADDYLAKPYSFQELLARIKAVMRRPQAIQTEILRCGQLELDPSRHSLKIKGKNVYLTRKEMMLLEYFLRNMGLVLSRAMIMEHVWDSEVDPLSNTIETHILSLRKKIEKGHKYIYTIPGRGYRFGE